MRRQKSHILPLLILTTALFCTTQVDASFQLPEDAYRVSELKSALKEAAEGKWPITFFLSDESVSCQFVSRASRDILQQLGEKSIILYVTPEQINGLPPTAFEALTSSKAGRMLPIAVVANSCADRIIDIVPYDSAQEAHLKMLKEAQQKMLEADAASCEKKEALPQKYWIIGGAAVLLLGLFIFIKK